MKRRDFLQQTGIGLAALSAGGLVRPKTAAASRGTRPNFLFISADDMSYSSLGCTGCPLPDISPNLDRLAGEGVLFDHCFVATPICGPSRAAWITGTWPQRNGCMGHYNQPPKWFGRSPVTTNVPELLRSQAGYFTGVVCKSPQPDGWDFVKEHTDTGNGRDPAKYHRATAEALRLARDQGKPFFLHVNSQDPHEYWAGQKYETKAWNDAMMGTTDYETYPNGKPYPDPQVLYSPDRIPVPPCWPDVPEVREDLCSYYNSVRRLDETVGAILRALEESGQAENTLTVFCSDNGIGRAFAKWSLYPLGTRTPLIVRWPGVTRSGRRDAESVFSAIDLAPTFLEAAGVDVPAFMDGESLLDVVRDARLRKRREKTFSCFNYMNNYPEKDEQFPTYTRDLADKHDNYRPMRAVHSRRFTYIWNGWANGRNEIPLEMSSSQIMRRLLQSTGHADRARFEALRAREEFYDTEADPGCLVNRIDDPALAAMVSEFRRELLALLEKTHDQEAANFKADFEALEGSQSLGSAG